MRMLRLAAFRFFCLIVAGVLIGSCGKVYDLNGADWQPDVPPSDSVFNREVQVLNLGARLPDGHVPLDEEDPMFFSLERFSSIGIAYRSTDRWDLSFSGMYGTNISANNGTRAGFGYGTSAIGGMVVLDAAYDDVTEVPDENLFKYPGVSGLDDQGAFGQGLGHLVYTFFGNPFRPDKMKDQDNPDPAAQVEVNKYIHMMYCLSRKTADTFKAVKVLRPRTLIIKTARGNYAKMEMQSVYDGITDPMSMRRDKDIKSPAYTFRYIVIRNENRRLGFRTDKPVLTVKL
jgi:hypothetical protein